jgi:hypothetical protein
MNLKEWLTDVRKEVESPALVATIERAIADADVRRSPTEREHQDEPEEGERGQK